mmetsp:Transcript_19659/g.40459  ORF Transcript_19659/g.40459 Transcript_19659/m.40459 type:complete len:106 (+) Transcript_19659:1641-1958(+)
MTFPTSFISGGSRSFHRSAAAMRMCLNIVMANLWLSMEFVDALADEDIGQPECADFLLFDECIGHPDTVDSSLVEITDSSEPEDSGHPDLLVESSSFESSFESAR